MSPLGALAGAVAGLARGRAADTGVVLGYHDVVGTEAAPATGYSVTPDALRTHIRLLRRRGFRLVTVGHLRRTVLGGGSTAGLAALTFDDGLVGVHRHALDVLADEDVTATVFAVSDAWGELPSWWPGSDRVMTRTELADVVAAGHEVGAHTRRHPSLPALDDADLDDELRRCRAELEDLAGAPVRTLAYPFGHHDRRVRAAVSRAGYDVATTFLNGRLTGAEDPLRLPRLTMTADHGRARLTYHLARPAASWPDHQLDAVGDAARPASGGTAA